MIQAFAILVAAAALTGQLASPPDKLVLLDGSAVEGGLVSIDSAGHLAANPALPALDLMGLRRVERPIAVEKATPAAIVYQHGGGVILAQSVEIHEQACKVTTALGLNVALPLETINAVLLNPPEQAGGKLDDGFLHERDALEAGKVDRLFVRTDKTIQQVSGLLKELGAEQVGFVWNDKPRTVARTKMYGLVLARLGPAPDWTGTCLVGLRDGSSLRGKVTGLAGGNLELTLGDKTPVALPWKWVSGIEVRSDRVAFLSDLNPVQAVQESFPTTDWTWQRDRNVMGKPITLGGKVYEKGLGVHARCVLTFEAAGKYDQFTAMIGLQPPVKDKGDCEFVVSADGRELYRKRMRGSDPPELVKVSIAGLKRVTLAVEPGEDLDLADHADWADARFIRESR